MLKILVLAEADRILNMGFHPQLERILEYLPLVERQMMLFSATQTCNVTDLARLSLVEPEYVGVHVRYVYDLFCSLQPGAPVMCLRWKIKQDRWTSIYFDFFQKKNVVMFATNLAARGLDLPNVDWVFQADAPENKDTYSHRMGRTAHYTSKGKSLLLVLPNEAEGFLKLFQQSSIPAKMLSMNPQKAGSISQRCK
jgi:ATP-dependent RNA helicase DDX10/DBP4